MTFDEWARLQPRGTMMGLVRAGITSNTTIHRLRRGGRVQSYELARRISDATGGAVSIAALCEGEELTARAS